MTHRYRRPTLHVRTGTRTAVRAGVVLVLAGVLGLSGAAAGSAAADVPGRLASLPDAAGQTADETGSAGEVHPDGAGGATVTAPSVTAPSVTAPSVTAPSVAAPTDPVPAPTTGTPDADEDGSTVVPTGPVQVPPAEVAPTDLVPAPVTAQGQVEGTAAEELPGPPENLRVSDVLSTSATVSWDPPTSGPEPTGYGVRIGSWTGETTSVLGADATSLPLTGLTSKESYSVTVWTLLGAERGIDSWARTYLDTRATANPPVGALDPVRADVEGFEISGWASDADADGPVRVRLEFQHPRWLHPLHVTDAVADEPRGGAGRGFTVGWRYNPVDVVLTGDYTACVYAYDPGEWSVHQYRTNLLGCQVITITDPPTYAAPVGDLELVEAYGTTVVVAGWALEPHGFADVDVTFVVDGSYLDQTGTDEVRDDVAAAFPGTGERHGFEVAFELPDGEHEVCVLATLRRVLNGPFGDLGCVTLTVRNSMPVGNFESLTTTASTVTLTGWALDPDTDAPVELHLVVDGAWGGSLVADRDRPDIARAFPENGGQHGFTHSFTAGRGAHQVCVHAIDTSTAQSTALGCRSVTVAGPPANRLPVANFESLTATGTAVTLSGWALDPDHVGAIDVHFYVNGGWGGSVSTTGIRSDVARAYPGTGDQHGFARTFTAGPGTHQVCTYAIDTTTRANTPMGCRTVTVAAPVNRLPLANFEALTASGSTVTLTGWALDPDHVGAIDVHFYVNGGWGGSVSTTGIRSDVARAYPGTGDQHGFTRSFTAGPGTHQICTYAIDTTTRANTPMGCRTVTVR